MRSPLVIGIIGGMGSGKDTAAKILEQSHGARSLAFADAMKCYLLDIFDLSHDQLWGPSETKGPEIRKLMQQFGTELCRGHNPDIWIDKLLTRIDNYVGNGVDPLGLQRAIDKNKRAIIVVTDIRFPNEAAALVKEYHALNLLIVPEKRNYSADIKDDALLGHASETSMWDIPPEHIYATVKNPGEFARYASNIHAALEHKI